MEKDKRAAIINSTVRSVAEYGFHGASIAVIASHAGVAAGTIYCHFDRKDLLIEESYRKVEGRCLAAVLQEYPGRGSLRQRWSHLAHRLIRHWIRFPDEFLFMDHFQSSPYMKRYIRSEPAATGLRTVVQLVREGTERRLFKNIPSGMLLALAYGSLVQALRAHTAGRVHCDDRLVAWIEKSCWDVLRRWKAPAADGARSLPPAAGARRYELDRERGEEKFP